MHVKRQGTLSGSNSNTSAPAATSANSSPVASATPTPTPTPTPTLTLTRSSTTSAPPSTSSVAPTPTVPTTLSTSSTSSVVSTTSTTVASSTTSTPVPTSAAPTSSSVITTTSLAPTSSSSAVTSVSRTSLSLSLVPTTSNGQIFTATVIVGGGPATSAAASTGKPFFQNTGAVVGVFVVVGIIGMALVVLFSTMFIRRRRAKQFDREVQEAAHEAARAQAPIDDDDDYGGGASYNTHASQPMSTERPGAYGAYGATAAASSWDPYGRAAVGAGYEMQHRRTNTDTAPAMAGYGAGDVFARPTGGADVVQGYNPNQGYGQAYSQDGYNTGYGQGYAGPQAYSTNYNASSPPQQSLAQPQRPERGRAPIQAQMMLPENQRHSYNNVGAYRSSPSYGQAHPGEQVEYGHAAQAENAGHGATAYGGNNQVQDAGYSPRPSEDAYGGYEYNEPGPSVAHTSNPPAYSVGHGGTAGATGDRKGAQGVARQPSGRSTATRYSQEEDDNGPRVLRVANQ